MKPLEPPDIGTRFGYLTVVENDVQVVSGDHKRPGCICKCDCGNTVAVPNYSLLHRYNRSCGCHIGVPGASDQKVRRRLKIIWSDMRARCKNPNCREYFRCGGRGITICDEWDDFREFVIWALANGYADDLTIDRIDVNGNYEPDNCRWATMREQQNNRRSNRYLTFNGKTQTVVMWARELGVNRYSLHWRLAHGWSVERALTEPYQQY